jgi:hypothetical protein
MDREDNPLSIPAIAAGLIVTLAGGIIVALMVGEGRFGPQQPPQTIAVDTIWLISGAAVLGIATLLSLELLRSLPLNKARRPSEEGKTLTYQARMETLTTNLANASSEVDKILEEISRVSQEREERLKTLETKLDELSGHEKEMQSRVEALKNMPLPAVEYFLEVTQKEERRSATRDYTLFALGVVASMVVTVFLKLVFGL